MSDGKDSSRLLIVSSPAALTDATEHLPTATSGGGLAEHKPEANRQTMKPKPAATKPTRPKPSRPKPSGKPSGTAKQQQPYDPPSLPGLNKPENNTVNTFATKTPPASAYSVPVPTKTKVKPHGSNDYPPGSAYYGIGVPVFRNPKLHQALGTVPRTERSRAATKKENALHKSNLLRISKSAGSRVRIKKLRDAEAARHAAAVAKEKSLAAKEYKYWKENYSHLQTYRS